MSDLEHGVCGLCQVEGVFGLVIWLHGTEFCFGACAVCTSLLASQLPGEPASPQLEQLPGLVRKLLIGHGLQARIAREGARAPRHPQAIEFIPGHGPIVAKCNECNGRGRCGEGSKIWRCTNCSGSGEVKVECAYCIDSCEAGSAYRLRYPLVSEICCDAQCAQWRIIGPVSDEKEEVARRIEAARQKAQPGWKPPKRPQLIPPPTR